MTSKERAFFEDLAVKHKESVHGNCMQQFKIYTNSSCYDDLEIKILADAELAL